jgi:hypothetical protein
MKPINKLISIALLTLAAGACTDAYDCRQTPAKPDDVAAAEYLQSFEVLKTYIADPTASPFRLGAHLSPADFLAQDLPYSMLLSNFQALELGNAFTPLSVTDDNGDPDFSPLQTLVEAAATAGLTLYGGPLLANTGQRTDHLNRLIAPIVIPIVPESGITLIHNFDDDPLGATYPMTGNSTATVVDDPDRQSGHVLRIGSTETPANRSYPQFTITLPEGRVLGDYTTLSIDFRGGGSTGLYGSGMVLSINGKTGSGYQSPSGYGCAGDVWGRGLIVLPLATIPLSDDEKQSTAFTLYVGSGTGAGNYFVDNLRMAYEKVASGKTVIDFETDAPGRDYPMTGNSLARVAPDPDGVSGQVLHVGQAGNAANYSYPRFQITLPAGQKLGNCTTVSVDFRGTGSTGLYGSGMRLRINGREKTYNSPSGYGCGDGRWGRGMIAMNLADFELTDDEKQLTTFELATGSGTGAGDYYLDNLTLLWKAEDIIIEKTEEEKKTLLTAELTQWMSGLLTAAGPSIRVWDVVGQPLDAPSADANPFAWKTYLGEPDYARTAAKIARDHAPAPLDLFVSIAVEPTPASLQQVDDLVALIAAWEADGDTKIDGINVLLHLNYSQNPTQQQANESTLARLFEKLAATQKHIRLSDLRMTLSNPSGTLRKAAELTVADRRSTAAYYTLVLQRYFSTVSKEQQYGLSLAPLSETNDGTDLAPWNGNNNRTEIYAGLVDGLKQR